MKNTLIALLVSFSFLSLSSVAADHAKTAPKKETKSVFFENVKDGQTLAPDAVVKFGLKGMTIHPAGELVEGTGHHHLIINGGPIPAGEAIVNDATHLHFGKGQTETKLALKPGDYTLTLQFADGAHRSFGPEMSSTIKIHIK